MIERIACLLILCITGTVSVYGQSYSISGRILDGADKNVLPQAMVLLEKKSTGSVSRFVTSDANGEFRIETADKPNLYRLRVTMMSYEPQVIELEESNEPFEIELIPSPTSIREVVVKPTRIWEKGDTVTYSVAAFARPQDRTIGDVLKNMPGISVSEDGEISYNGATINKFYIEGSDLLGGRYGIATNSVSHKDIQSVEVYENHQPIRALQSISFSDKAGINLKIKEGAKSTWGGNILTGAGASPFLWQAEAAGMMFSSEYQNLSAYKTNNIGVDLARQMREFSLEDILNANDNRYTIADYIQVKTSLAPNLDRERSLFNETHLGTTNQLWKLSNEYELKLNVNYLNNRLESKQEISRTYYLVDEPEITEDIKESVVSRINHIDGEIVLTANKEKFYLNNTLSAHMGWNRTGSEASGSLPNNQRASLPDTEIYNDFQLIRTMNKSLFTVTSNNRYNRRNHWLEAIRPQQDLRQELELNSFFSNTNVSYGVVFAGMSVSLRGGVRWASRSMNSDLYGIPENIGTLSNDLNQGFISPYIAPKIELKKDIFEARLELPTHFSHYWYRNRLVDTKAPYNSTYFSPKLTARLWITSRLNLHVSGGINRKSPDDNLFYEGLLMNNYRELSIGNINYFSNRVRTLTGGLNFRSPLNGIFGGMSASLLSTRNGSRLNQHFTEEYIISSHQPDRYTSEAWMINGNITKTLDLFYSTLTLSSNYLSTAAELVRNDEAVNYSTGRWSSHVRIDAKPSRWLNFDYELEYTSNTMTYERDDINERTDQYRHRFSVHINPVRSLSIGVSGEHYDTEVSKGTRKKSSIMDTYISYTPKPGLEIKAAVVNVLNTKEYAYTIYDALSIYSYRYKLRPVNAILSVYYMF